MEYRSFRADEISADVEGKLSGVGAPFNSETIIGDLKRGGWREEIAPGAFAKALRESDTVLLCDHDMAKPLARKSAGTLTLRETGAGLAFEADVAPTSYAKDLLININARNKGGMSIGFDPVKEDWYDDAGKPSNRIVGTRRVLREVRLPELSCVTNPAYKDTTVLARDALLAERETRAAKATYADLETCGECGATNQYGAYCAECGEPMKNSKPAGDYCTSCGAPLDDDNRSSHRCAEFRDAVDRIVADELRASNINTAGRKALAKKGHALPDGSYPIPDVSHLHAAAVLAASKHGDYKAAKALIRRRAKDLGVDVKTLPGFGGKGKKANRSADDGIERRIKKSVAKRVAILDVELKQAAELIAKGDAKSLQDAQALVASSAEHVGHIMHKENLSAKDTQRSKQKPDTSTSADEDTDYALRIAEAELDIRSRELGFG